jgi:2-amino-4-hydroxy-6-hydroxymethyldihydropteridine diphosphokinase
MKHTVYLALGTNLGDRIENLQAAVHALAPEVIVSAESKIYETSPWGYEDQPAFLNMAIRAETDLEPDSLLKYLKALEARLGRTQSFHWGPRVIDIDILFYDGLVIDSPAVVIPHPHLQERGFVLVPLSDIAPDFIHPVLKKTIKELLSAMASLNGITPYTAQRRGPASL